MARLHSVSGPVSDRDPRRKVWCGCEKWEYTSPLVGDEGRKDCDQALEAHQKGAEHQAWLKAKTNGGKL